MGSIKCRYLRGQSLISDILDARRNILRADINGQMAVIRE